MWELLKKSANVLREELLFFSCVFCVICGLVDSEALGEVEMSVKNSNPSFKSFADFVAGSCVDFDALLHYLRAL